MKDGINIPTLISRNYKAEYSLNFSRFPKDQKFLKSAISQQILMWDRDAIPKV